MEARQKPHSKTRQKRMGFPIAALKAKRRSTDQSSILWSRMPLAANGNSPPSSCDFNLPERFDLSFVNEKGEKERIVVIHRAISGSIERFIAVLIEHFAGKFPVWLAPVQATVLPVSEKFADYGKKTHETLLAGGIRAELSEADESLGKRIRAAEMMKIPYILVVGEKEEGGGTVNVRDRKGEEKEIVLAEFVKKIEDEIKEKAL